MGYSWKEGFHAPKGVSASDAYAAVVALGDDISPENLMEASKDQGHALHQAVWEEGDQAWARRGRIEFCRKVIGGLVLEVQTGPKRVEMVRAVEFVRGAFLTLDTILDDPELVKELIGQVATGLQQLQVKLIKIQQM